MPHRVYAQFQQSVEAKMQVGEQLAPLIANASEKIVESLLQDSKILVCGNGSSSSIARIFTSALLDKFERERPSLPAIWLDNNIAFYSSVTSELSSSEIFSKPIRALGKEGDVLVIFSTSGNSNSLIQAITAAHDRNISVIAITGRDGGDISPLLNVHDIEICVAIDSRSRIQEIHLLTLFCLCDLIDNKLFGIE